MSAPRSRTGLFLGLSALGVLGVGALIFMEVIRPFRDNNIDMPMAVASGVLAASMSSGALSFHKGARILNMIVLILSMLALFAVAFIIQALSHMRFM